MVRFGLAALLAGGLAANACSGKTADSAAIPTGSTGVLSAGASAARIDVAVTSDGFVASRTTVKVGQPVTKAGRIHYACAMDMVHGELVAQ